MVTGSWTARLKDWANRLGAVPAVARLRTWGEGLQAPELSVLCFLALLAHLLAHPQNPMLDMDAGWLIRTGELIWREGRLPPGDVFSFTHAGRAWILYQWGFELYLAGLHYLANLGGVVWGTALIIALAYSLLLHFLVRLGLPRLVAVGLVLATILVNKFSWYTRPGTVTVLFYTVLLLKLESYRRGPRQGRLWTLPLIFLVWANIHLGFLMGLGVVLFYGLWAFCAPETFRGPGQPPDRRVLLILPFCLGVSCLNPYGYFLFVYFWQLSQANMMNQAIIELKSPDFHLAQMFFFFCQIVLLLWYGGNSYPGRGALLTLVTVTLAMALFATRNIPFFSLPATLHLAYSLKTRYPGLQPGATRLRQGWRIAAALGVIFSLIWVVGIESRRPGFYYFETRLVPRGAADYLARHTCEPRPCRVFVQDGQWASYLIYHLYPQARVFIDSRFDMYGDKFFALFMSLQRQVGNNPDILGPWGVDFLVLDKARLTNRPQPRPDWTLAYEDKRVLIYRPQKVAGEASEPPNPYR